MTLTWYALTVPPQKERVAETILQKVQVPCFVPVELKYPRKRARFQARDKKLEPKRYPMFIRYVFAGFEGPIPLYDLSRLNVVTGVVGFDGRPFPIPQSAIDRLMKLSGTSIPWRNAPNPHKSFRTGDTVELVEGAFTGHTVDIIEVDQDGKFFEFLVRFMGKQQRVRQPLAFAEAA
jgi:transcription termination/antitermination protein NusG